MPILPETNSMIASSFKKARLGIQIMIIAIILGLSLLIVEHLYFQDKVETAKLHQQSINRATTELIHLDEQLTLNAAMAVHSGEQKWINHYNIYIKKLDDTMDKVKNLVSTNSINNFEEEIKYVNAALISLETKAMNSVEEGNLEEAKKTFYSQEYNDYKTDFSNATIKFISIEKARISADLRVYTMMANIFEIISVIIISIILLVVWRMISSNMSKSEEVYSEAEAEIRHTAHHDHLTGLPNRGLLINVLNNYIDEAKKSKEKLAVLVMDLDKFKPINDAHGHLAGDVVLKEFAKRMTSIFGEEALCSRLGGDEFVCVLSKQEDVNRALELSKKFINLAKKPIISSGVSLSVGTSIGISFYTEHGEDCDSLLYHADIALYEAKKSGRGTAFIYAPSMENEQDEVESPHRKFRSPNKRR